MFLPAVAFGCVFVFWLLAYAIQLRLQVSRLTSELEHRDRLRIHTSVQAALDVLEDDRLTKTQFWQRADEIAANLRMLLAEESRAEESERAA